MYEHFRKSKHKPCACPPRWILKRRQFLKGRKTHPTCASSIFHLLVFSGSASWVSRCDEFGWGRPEIYVSVGTEMRPWTAELITASSQKMWIDVSAPYSHPGSASLIPSVWGAGCECKDCLQIWIKSHFGMAKLVMPLPEIKFHFWITILWKRLRFNLIFQLAACKAIRKGLLQPINPSYVGHMAQLSSLSFVNYLMLPSRCSHLSTLAPSTRLPAPWRPSDKITH